MGFTKSLAPVIALLATLPAVYPLAMPSARRPPVREAATEAAERPLRAHMEGLKTHMKGTAMALQSPEGRDKALEHIAELQRIVLLAKLEAPSNLGEVAEKERAEHAKDFRRDLTLVLRELAEMEIHVLDGEMEKAFARVVDPLFPMREAAHEKYQLRDG